MVTPNLRNEIELVAESWEVKCALEGAVGGGRTSGGFALGNARENIGALKIRIGFWGSSYYNYNMEPPKVLLMI